jgi:hypothetical protein
MCQRLHVGKGGCPDDESAASSGRNRVNFFEKETQPHPLNFSTLRSAAFGAKMLDACLDIARPDPCAISSIQIQCDRCEFRGR